MSGSPPDAVLPAIGEQPHGRRRAIATAVVVVLAVATLYETLLALEVVSIGELPGEGAPGADLVAAASALALLVGVVLLAGSIGRPEAIGDVLLPLLPLTAGLLVVAAYYTYDPYYAPTHRRYSDHGTWPAWWIFLVLAGAIWSAVVARLRPRAGAAAGAAVMLVCLVTFFLKGIGH